MRWVSLIVVFYVGSQAWANEPLEEIRVIAHPLSEQGAAQSLSVLSGQDLAEKVAGSLGATLAGEAGIQSASFGSAVGRPVIHGLGGARVKTTEDRIDSLDVSVTSSDHAVTIEPFIANQITVLKGASTLLYGSGAIGGVVDVETGRIPTAIPDDSFAGKLELRANDNANASTAALRLDGLLQDQIAWHVDAFARDADDYDIPDFVESQALREREEAEVGEVGEVQHERDVLLGSTLQNKGGALGFSKFGDKGFAGISISTLDAQYGLVGGHEEEEEEGQSMPDSDGTGMIDMQQFRVDLDSQLLNPFAGADSFKVRLGINDYQHQEVEASGEIGTEFDNQAWEGRAELEHASIAGFEGVLGLQLGGRKFSAIGEEAFVAPVETDSAGIFWVGEKSFKKFDLETGLRFEKQKHKPSEIALSDTEYSSFSSSLGFVWPVSDSIRLSALLDYSSRAPSIEELYSMGPHLATSSFEVGNSDLSEESVLAFTLTANVQSALYDINISLYSMQFDDFIYQANTGEFIDELPVLVYQQSDATFTGIDVKADFHLSEFAGGDFDVNVLFDLVNASLDKSDVQGLVNRNLPRIPARRIGLGLAWTDLQWKYSLDATRVSAQSDTAEFELPTAAYYDIGVSINRFVELGDKQFNIFLHGRNLSNQEQRHHTSIVKDFAPAPGRRFEIGLRLKF